jgi:hypothetical protein
MAYHGATPLQISNDLSALPKVNPNVVGRRLLLDGHPMTIIGVAPKDYLGLNTALEVEAYIPLAIRDHFGENIFRLVPQRLVLRLR